MNKYKYSYLDEKGIYCYKNSDVLINKLNIQDEETFYNTAITEQDGIRLSKSSQASIVQKITNLISSGDGNISYSKAASKIAKEQLEKVGTERTVQKNRIACKCRKPGRKK